MRFGEFSREGKEFIIKNSSTPSPWINILCPNKYGVIVTQEGCGYSWYVHAKLNRITFWRQNLENDVDGKFIFLKENGDTVSLTYKPFGKRLKGYRCIHGLGYTKFISVYRDLNIEVRVFVPLNDSLEVWSVFIENRRNEKRNIELSFRVKWWLGSYLEEERELQKLFYRFEKEKDYIIAKKIAKPGFNKKGQFLNEEYPYKGFLFSKDADFTFSDITKEPEVAANVSFKLKGREKKEIHFILGVFQERKVLRRFLEKYEDFEEIKREFERIKKYWEEELGRFKIRTKNKYVDFMVNYWLKYQTISSRIKGRNGYYQIGGNVGFRDQLQDSLIYLYWKSEKTKKQILLNASKQYKSGRVLHWWNPFGAERGENRFSDTPLWLCYAVIEYIRRTGDFDILKEKVSYFDGGKESLYNHCERAIEYVLENRSSRGIPLILEGDWNDGLSAVGWKGKGESFWVGMFLYKILNEWDKIISEFGKRKRYRKEADSLRDAINRYGWDGEWYIRATKDSGEVIGSKKCKYGKIYLNTQTWSIISGVITEERKRVVLKSLDKYLYKEMGPLLLWPAYRKEDPEIGYITRYSPGTRENGAVYMHAACWAIMAEVIAGRKEKAIWLFNKIFPPYQDSRVYFAEPYITSANIDGPDSETPKRGSWSWYTGSAGWLFRVIVEYLKDLI
ncbi:MAG: glycosyl transferase family 36 [Caldiserica bacterium]|nr:MAG: glycosyl transferase family 36 [Caldisericota bacterium]